MKKKNNKYIAIFMILSLVFFIIGIAIYGNVNIRSYNHVYLLPIGFGVFTLLIGNLYSVLKKHFVFWLITLQQVIRYVITPILFLSEDNIKLGNITNNAPEAIVIMLLELFIIYIAYNIVYFKTNNSNSKINKIEFLSLGGVNFLMFISFILVVVFSGSFLQKLNFVWDFSSYVELQSKGELELEGISPFVTVMFPVMRAYIVLYIFSIIDSLKIKLGTKLLLSILVVLLNATIIIGTSRFSIVYATFPLILLLIYLYPYYRRNIIKYSSLGALLILIPASLTKYSGVAEIQDAGDFLSIYQLNAYFSGVANNAIGYDAYEKDNVDFFDRFGYLLADITQNIPILSKYSDDQYKTIIKFNKMAYGQTINRDQIAPISIAGLYHFSIYFFYIYFLIFVVLAFSFEKKAYLQNSPILFFIYIILAYTCSSIMMINIGSMVSSLMISLVVFIPLFKIIKSI